MTEWHFNLESMIAACSLGILLIRELSAWREQTARRRALEAIDEVGLLSVKRSIEELKASVDARDAAFAHHDKECAGRWGSTEQKLGEIDRRLTSIENRLVSKPAEENPAFPRSGRSARQG